MKPKEEFECERMTHRGKCSRRPGMVDLVMERSLGDLEHRGMWVGAVVVEVSVWLETSLSSKSRRLPKM